MIPSMFNNILWILLKEESKGFDYLRLYLEESKVDFTYYFFHFGTSESKIQEDYKYEGCARSIDTQSLKRKSLEVTSCYSYLSYHFKYCIKFKN